MSVGAIITVIIGVLPNILNALQAILSAIAGGQPVTPAHMAALRKSLDELHDKVDVATKQAQQKP